MDHPDGEVTVAVVGKYTVLKDAYKSLIEALAHGGLANKVKVNLDWVESEAFEGDPGAAAALRVRPSAAPASRSRWLASTGAGGLLPTPPPTARRRDSS